MSKVVKFGGSSLASAEQFAKVGKIIHADKERRYVVPSAPGKRNSKDTKVTDMLYACYDLVEKDEDFRVILDANPAAKGHALILPKEHYANLYELDDELAGKSYDALKTVVCHLGNGASICAVENGKSVDTSMGLTPLEGLVMGTRCGDIDPSIMEFIAKKENLDIEGVMNVLNKKSGVAGMSGVSSDFRDLEAAYNEGNERAIEAVEVFSYRVAKYIGAYVAAMNGVDAIAFTAGIGENTSFVREKIMAYLGYLGIKIDHVRNDKAHGIETLISTADSKVKVCVIPTNEELAICRETVKLVG